MKYRGTWTPIFWAALSLGCTQGTPKSTSMTPVPKADAQLTYQKGTYQLNSRPVHRSLVPSMTQWMEENEAPFGGVLTVRVAATESMGVLKPAIYSAAQAGFHTAWLLVAGPGGESRGIRFSLRVPKAATQTAKQAPADFQPKSHWANPTITIDPNKGLRFAAFDDVYGSKSGILIPCGASGCANSNYPYLELTRLARRLKLDHPGDRAVLVKTTDEVLVQDFVSTLDALRDDGLTGSHHIEMFTDPILHLKEPQ